LWTRDPAGLRKHKLAKPGRLLARLVSRWSLLGSPAVGVRTLVRAHSSASHSPVPGTWEMQCSAHPSARSSLIPRCGRRSLRRTGCSRAERNDRACGLCPGHGRRTVRSGLLASAAAAAERRLAALFRWTLHRPERPLGATRPGSGVPAGLNARLVFAAAHPPGRRRWGGVRPVRAPLDAPPPRLAYARRKSLCRLRRANSQFLLTTSQFLCHGIPSDPQRLDGIASGNRSRSTKTTAYPGGPCDRLRFA
jgi:hypothetical protein